MRAFNSAHDMNYTNSYHGCTSNAARDRYNALRMVILCW